MQLSLFRLICLLAPFLPVITSANGLLDYLKKYEGAWTGDYSIHSTANGYTESFAVEQRYWWEGEVLHGLSVSDRKGGMVTSTTTIRLDGEKLLAEVLHGEKKEIYFGVFHDGGLLWIPANKRRLNDHQMRERFIEKAGMPDQLIIEGFDTYITGEGLAHLVFKGAFKRQPEDGDE